MKILYLIPGMGGGGGAERSLAAMVPHWTEHVDLHLVTFSGRDALAEDLVRAGARITNVGPLDRAALIRAVQAIARQSRPDLIHTTLFDADLVGRLASVRSRTPVSTSLVNVNYGHDQLIMPGRKHLNLRAAQLADAVSAQVVSRFHALTHHVADLMARRLAIRRSRVDVIPRGREAAALGERTGSRRSVARASLGVGRSPLVVAAARHEWQKGLDVLVRAAPRILESLPDAEFLIGGRPGPQSALLESLVHDLGLDGRVRFIGPRSDVPELMCAADVFCVPSRWEGFGSILVEAMALGVPTVATDIGSIREVAGPTPWLRLARPDDVDDLGRAVIQTLLDPEGSAGLALLGKDRFANLYTAEVVAQQMLGFFDRAVTTSRWR